MAIQLINIGQVANDGTGDDLREAMIKINQNFEELDLRDDEQTTASNIGDIGLGVFNNRVNYDLQFKKLVPGQNINLTASDSTIVFDVPQIGLQQLIISGDNGSLVIADGDTINIVGGTGITTSVDGNGNFVITNESSEIVTDTTPQLGGTLDAQVHDITNVGNIDALRVTAGEFIGNLSGNVNGIDIRVLAQYVQDFNFGEILQDIENPLEWILSSLDIDLGTIQNPDTRSVDFGTLI